MTPQELVQKWENDFYFRDPDKKDLDVIFDLREKGWTVRNIAEELQIRVAKVKEAIRFDTLMLQKHKALVSKT